MAPLPAETDAESSPPQKSRGALITKIPATGLTVQHVRQLPSFLAQRLHHRGHLSRVHHGSHPRRRLVQQPGIVVRQARHPLNLRCKGMYQPRSLSRQRHSSYRQGGVHGVGLPAARQRQWQRLRPHLQHAIRSS